MHGHIRGEPLPEPTSDLPSESRWAVHALRCAVGNFDTMLDGEPVPVNPTPSWAAHFQRFADFLAASPSGPELKRKRTNAAFVSDLSNELAEEANRARITIEQMGDWTLQRSDDGIKQMPSLGLFREVMREKLCKPTTRWRDNDLQDMMYLTCAAAYCDQVVGERTHTSHMENGLRRLGRTVNVHRTLRALVDRL